MLKVRDEKRCVYVKKNAARRRYQQASMHKLAGDRGRVWRRAYQYDEILPVRAIAETLECKTGVHLRRVV